MIKVKKAAWQSEHVGHHKENLVSVWIFYYHTMLPDEFEVIYVSAATLTWN